MKSDPLKSLHEWNNYSSAAQNNLYWTFGLEVAVRSQKKFKYWTPLENVKLLLSWKMKMQVLDFFFFTANNSYWKLSA